MGDELRKALAEGIRIGRALQAPDSAEAQALIEESLRRERVEANRLAALEHTPEAFGRVTMLYINASANRVPVQAFVDCGAQETIISAECARRTGLDSLLDTRFAGMAHGVGSARILGRIHAATLQLGGSFFSTSFSVLEGRGPDMLLGLDMLRRHQACIDLSANVLRIGNEAVPFLSEHEILTKDAFGEAPKPEDVQDSSTTTSTVTEESLLPSPPVPSSSASSLPSVQPSSPSVHTPLPLTPMQRLLDMGFPESSAQTALEATNGNVELAAQLLLETL